eukprot:8327874-Alexandrium_andersonii.AAC.1
MFNPCWPVSISPWHVQGVFGGFKAVAGSARSSLTSLERAMHCRKPRRRVGKRPEHYRAMLVGRGTMHNSKCTTALQAVSS